MKRPLLLTLAFHMAILLTAQQSGYFYEPIAESEVYFPFGKYELNAEALAVLDTLLHPREDAQRFSVIITAHTDSIGSFSANMQLSRHRAEAVQAHLRSLGFTSENMLVEYYGEGLPAHFNDAEEQRRLNRRATISVRRKIPAMPLEGTVLDTASGKGIEADVIVHGKFFRDSLHTDTSGYFRTEVPIGAVVAIDVFAEGYFLKTTMLKALPGRLSPVSMQLQPAKPGEKVAIQNLYFVGNQAILLKKSEPELPKIQRFLTVNPGIRIELAGHVNEPNKPPVSKNTWQYRLSVDRAKMVYDYLLTNGISASRIRYRGYGNWEMVHPYAISEAQQALNRRVEIRILPPEAGQ